MTTFDIDGTKKTKHLEVLESLVEQGHALQSTHNPQTWRLSALTFALHLNDCIILFQKLKDKWAKRLPLSEAWDVDFTEWKTRIWSLVNNVSSFTEEPLYDNWQRLCEEDYHTFLIKANKCLTGELPLKDLTDFLSEKNTELKMVIIDSGQDLSTLFTETESMLYNTSSELYEQFYEDMVNIYMTENETPYQIEESGMPVPYERWKASKSIKRLPELLISKIRIVSTSMLELKTWNETWSECFDVDKHEIDKEGFARYIFQNRKRIIENKQYPCKNSLWRCFATLCLCEHLWDEYDLIKDLENDINIASGDTSEPNYNAPKINLQRLLQQSWFAEIRSDEKYNAAWTDNFIEALMASDYGEGIARDWAVTRAKGKKNQLKGYVVGLLKDLGVLKGSYDCIAGKIAIMDNSRTFSNYMSRGKEQPYADWVKEYVSKSIELKITDFAIETCD